MNFELTGDQQAFQDAARAFARAEMAPHAAHWDEDKIFPVEIFRAAGELGFMGLYSPESSGGLALSRLDSTLVLEELAAACTSTAAYISIHNMAAWMVGTWGTDAVTADWGPALTSGTKLASYCLTEPAAGSDAASLRTSARRAGDDYVINGSKMFISGAGSTDLLVVMARTGTPEQGAKGISAFAIPADLPGIHYGKNESKMGWNSQPTRAITFENVRLPSRYLLDEEGKGFTLAMRGLDGGRINIATCSIGAAQAVLEHSLAYVQERQQFQAPLADLQSIQFKLADMATELVAARQMVRLAASRLDNDHPEKTATCAMAKRFATDIGFGICDQALQLHGGYGYIREYPIERYFRDTRVHQILEGTNEIMRLIIARRLLDNNALETLK